MDNEKEISFGAFDSELMRQEITIPEGFEATIDGDKIILKKIESEDEKVRKALVELVKCNERSGYTLLNNVSTSSMLDWLEKQGEHKKFRDSIQVGDEVTRNSDGVIVNLSQLKRVAKKSEQKLPIEKLPEEMKTIGESLGFTTQEECDEYNEMVTNLIMGDDDKDKPKFKVGDWVVRKDGKPFSNGNHYAQITVIDKEQYWFDSGTWLETKDIRLWTIQDAKKGDVLYSPCLRLLWIFKSRDTVYCGCNLNYNDGAFCGEGYFERPTDAIPATKEQRDLLFQKMKEAGYEWDSEKKELKKIGQNIEMVEALRTEYEKGRADVIAEMQKEWSKEDENHVISLLERLEGLCRNEFERTRFAINEDQDWLKSLKERYFWKPKTWEIQILESVIEKGENPKNYSATLHSILEQLKKLKGE